MPQVLGHQDTAEHCGRMSVTNSMKRPYFGGETPHSLVFLAGIVTRDLSAKCAPANFHAADSGPVKRTSGFATIGSFLYLSLSLVIIRSLGIFARSTDPFAKISWKTIIRKSTFFPFLNVIGLDMQHLYDSREL